MLKLKSCLAALCLTAATVTATEAFAADVIQVEVEQTTLGDSWKGVMLQSGIGVQQNLSNNSGVIGYVVGPGVFISNENDEMTINSSAFFEKAFSSTDTLKVTFDVDYFIDRSVFNTDLSVLYKRTF